MRAGLATLVIVVMVLAGCRNDRDTPKDAPTASAVTPAPTAPAPAPIVIALAKVPQGICQPPGVPGNCWLPFYALPRVEGLAINQSSVCNSQSRDQSSCWPQPNTTVEVICFIPGPDGREWYGVRVPQEHITANLPEFARAVPDGTDILGFAAAEYLDITDTARSSLPHCAAIG